MSGLSRCCASTVAVSVVLFATQACAEYMEVTPHDVSVFRPTAQSAPLVRREDNAASLDRQARDAGILMEIAADGQTAWPWSTADSTDSGVQQPAAVSNTTVQRLDKDMPMPRKAADLKWGTYRFMNTESLDQCVEAGVSTWEGKSFFDLWSGTDSGLTLTEGTTVQQGVAKQTPNGLRIYKAACPNSTTVKVGGIIEIPVGTSTVDIVFGISRKCTGDCAPFMASVLDASTDAVKHRWCWNREGNSPGIWCDNVSSVEFHTWHHVSLDISNFTDYITPIKLELAVYTSGDFRNLPALPGEKGVGGRAMVLIDTLLFGPSERPAPDSNYRQTCSFCRQAMRDTCLEDSWCMDKYRCFSGWCAEGRARCNAVRNCPDDSDEVGCEYKMGFHGEFFLSHGQDLHSPDLDVGSLTGPDVRRLHEQIEYDTDDWWESLKVRDHFAARWMGNFSITNGGHYKFEFPVSGGGKAALRITGQGSISDKEWNVTSDQWLNMPAGVYELSMTYIQLEGRANLILKYAGVDTRGQLLPIPREIVTSTMTGPRCDTMYCSTADALVRKPDFEKLLCNGVPCKQETDTATCCTRQYKAVSCGDSWTCALDVLGRPVCWGSWKGFNEQWKEHPGPFVDISVGSKYICAVLKENQMVDCWQPDDVSARAVDYSPGNKFVNISVGGEHSCALRDTGFVACTGSNKEEQTYAPQVEYARVTSGHAFSCGIVAADKTVQCWGSNTRGEATPPTGTGHDAYTHIGAGKYHACGISDGSVHCWGWNNDAQATAPAGKDFAQVAPGGKHTCALKKNGQAVCWGSNAQGQSEPIKGDGPFSTISSGAEHTCAIRAADKEVSCWGSNFEESWDGSMTWRGQAKPPPAKIWP